MPDRAALLIAVETFFEAGPAFPYANADLTELSKALPEAGYRREKCLLATGHRTTKTGIESHLRRLPKLLDKGDSLLVVIATRGFSHKGRGYLACADTLAADPLETALPVADLLAALHKIRCPEIAVLLDIDPLTPTADFAVDADPGLDAAELAKLFGNSPSCVGLVSTEPGERSHESGTLRHGIWRHHLLEAFTAKARIPLGPDGLLTAVLLQNFLEDAVPRTVRRTGERSLAQRPTLFGEANAATTVADLSALLGPAGSELLDPARLKRVVFRAESVGRIKDMAGYRKSQGLPERVNDWARKFVARIAAPDLQADLAAMFDTVREAFAYKRKDIDVSVESDGLGFLRTPDFDYSISVTIDPVDPSAVIWRREVGRLNDAGFVRSEGFVSVFGSTFDQLAFEFATPVDVAALVDRLEDDPPEGVKVNVGSDADVCEVKLTGFVGNISIARQSLVIEGRTGNSAGLLDQFLLFLTKFGPLGESKALVPRKGN